MKQLTERTSELVGTSGQAEKEAADAAAAASAAEAEAEDVEVARQELQRWQDSGDLLAIEAAKNHLAQQEAEAELAAALCLGSSCGVFPGSASPDRWLHRYQ